jgi:predicted peroxiredoxin
MTPENTPQEYRPLSRQDLEELAGEELPERAAMSLINANIAAPVNAAVALNALSDGSTAVADATQTAPISQVNS